MGINGLLRNTKSVGQKKHISDYRNKTVAIDGYSWLHKSLYRCALEVYVDKNIDGVVQFFAKKINYFLKLKIKVVLVFDGDDLPLKKLTNQKRKTGRKEKMKQAQMMLKAHDLENARKLLSISLDVTPDMVYTLKQDLQLMFPNNVEFIVAPYEADSQLAYLSKINYVDLIISEDSDLLVFGALEVFYKMDNHYYGVVYQQKNLKFCEEINIVNWSFTKFIQFCILSGCDYLSSPKGIGMKTAYQLITRHDNIDKIVQILKKDLDDSYFKNFLYAYSAFKYSKVFCPKTKQIVTLNPMDFKDTDIKNCFDKFAAKQSQKNYGSFDFLGEDLSQKISNEIANCEIHPKSKKIFEKVYKTKKSRQLKGSNYYKRKLDIKLTQAVSSFQLKKDNQNDLQIKKLIGYKTLTQDSKHSSSFKKSQEKNTKSNTQVVEKQMDKKQEVDSKDSTDYESFLEDFLTQNQSLRIDCQNILRIFDKNIGTTNQYLKKIIIIFIKI